MKKFLLVLLALVLVTPMFAAIGTLKITDLPGNVSSVLIDGKVQTINKMQLQGGVLSFKVLQGTHNVKITLPGKSDFVASVKVGKSTTIKASFASNTASQDIGSIKGGTEASNTTNSLAGKYGKPADATQSPKRFIGKGYDFFSNYAEEGKVKSEEILLFDELNEAGLLVLSTVKKSEIKELYGKDIAEYSKSYKIGAGVEAEVAGFSGSLETSFGEAKSNSNMTAFTTIQGLYYHYKENIKNSYATDTKVLKQFLSSRAKELINSVSNTKDAINIFRNLGTHVIIADYQGGRVSYSEKTNSKKYTSASDFALAVKAKYSGAYSVGGSANTSINKTSNNENENKNVRCIAYGGNSQYGFEIKAQDFKPWEEGLENKENWTLCAFPIDDEGQALLPIWELCDKEETKTIFKAAFKEWENSNRYVIPTATPERLYIVELKRVMTGRSSNIPEAVKDGIDGDGHLWYRLGSDFNWGTSKQNHKIFLYYRLGTKDENPITNIAVWGADKNFSVPEGFTEIGDMNDAGAGGYYVRIGYKRDPDAKEYLTGLKQTISHNNQTHYSLNAESVKNWKVFMNQKESANKMDFNRGNGKSSADIFLYYTMEPIEANNTKQLPDNK